jgi:hypothetical protein
MIPTKRKRKKIERGKVKSLKVYGQGLTKLSA